jgi:hypothetical protein
LVWTACCAAHRFRRKLYAAFSVSQLTTVPRWKSATDSPWPSTAFAETKEQLAGYYIVDCPDLDEAIEWARKLPTGRGVGSDLRFQQRVR